ncbi:MAG: VOC family protein [Streptosporangiaceae bacterium]
MASKVRSGAASSRHHFPDGAAGAFENEADGDHARLPRPQRADGYQPPSWPDQSVPQELHLDFEVDDLDEAEARVLELGAAKPEFQPGGDRAPVFTDPAGHPFCLARN